MFNQETRLKAERLGLDVEVEIVAKTLAGFRAEFVVAGLCRAEQTEFHDFYFHIQYFHIQALNLRNKANERDQPGDQ